MNRYIPIAAIAFAITASLAAESPKGWKVRVDRSASASDPDGGLYANCGGNPDPKNS